MSRLPVEVEIEILVRLPAKSLLRFKSVCKLWRELINDAFFKNRHMEQSKKRIILRTSDQDDLYMCDTFENPRSLNFPFRHWRSEGVWLVGSCRGLLCFEVRGTTFFYNPSTNTYKGGPYSLDDLKTPNTMFLYNPTTKTYKALPSLDSSKSSKEQCLFFGYDQHSQDYKCASIALSISGDAIRGSPVMVYSLRHDAWKPSANDARNYSDDFKREFYYPVVVNGVVHSAIEFDGVTSRHIVGFDLTNEALRFISLPVNIVVTQNVWVHQGRLDSCLCLIYNNFHHYDIWMMKEYGVATSWMSICRVEHSPGLNELMRPISFLKSTKELVLVESSNGNLAAFDLKTKKILTVAHPLGFLELTGSFVCLENLLVLDDGQHIPGKKYQPQNIKKRIIKTYY